jgi:cell division protein FtsQ
MSAHDLLDDPEVDDTTGRRISRRALLIAAVVVVVFVIGLGTWLVAFSSVFGVRTVVVRGQHTLSAEQVTAAAAVPHGQPLLRLDTAAIRERVEQLPDVASATVTTAFPSTVRISVTERVAVGVVRHGRQVVLVDRTGDQFRAVAHRPRQLPLFVVPAGTDARSTGGAVATVAGALPATIRARVASIQALDPQAITLLLKNGRVVRWGSAARSADKARVLTVLLHRPADQIDLTDPDQPFTR